MSTAGPRDTQRFPRDARLTERADFNRLFEGGERWSSACWRIHACARPEGGARVGLVVAKRVSMSAVARNGLKRLVREHFRRTRAARPGVDMVVVAKPGAAAVDRAQLRMQLEQLFDRAFGKLKRDR